MKFTIIGITDNPDVWFPRQVMEIIRQGTVFSGGVRHHDLVRRFLPAQYEWIDIAVPLDDVFRRYRELDADVVCFASGDPLFYGFAGTVMRLMPEAEVLVFPAFNSLQMLAHRLLLPYQDMRMVSQTGRPWQPLDEALIRRERLIGVLTDKTKTPQVIAQRMQTYGYTGYTMFVGECLGNPQCERITHYDLAAVQPDDLPPFQQPNCVILLMSPLSDHSRAPRMGIPESEFHLLDGRANMITKAPIRLLTLSALQLHSRSCMWDVGFCTGSVSIEARLQFPHLHIEAFEVRPEGEELMRLNAQKFGAPGIETHIGDFLQADLSDVERPDAVFIGGHGGCLHEMVARVSDVLVPGGVLVFNSVSRESQDTFRQSVLDAGMQLQHQTRVALDDHNAITIMTATLAADEPSCESVRQPAQRVLHLGIGCAHDCPVGQLPDRILDLLHAHQLDEHQIATLDTIPLKADEPLVLALLQRLPWAQLMVHQPDELRDIPVPNPSAYAMQYVGLPSVSEASALTYGPLLLEKQKVDGLCTIAVSESRAAVSGGHIEIVGAGPGDPELVSVRGMHFLQRADLILYAGSLVPERLTHYGKPSCTVRSSASMNLEEQFALMKEFYDRGQLVVRLHTGDPCIYGAIQEQMALFDAHGMEYHITPGISAFQAAAAELHSQFTIPEKVQTIILTRGEGRTPMPEKEQLHRLAQSQSTMCIYLSAAIAQEVQDELLQAYPPETPVAACYKLTWPEQRIYRGRLCDLAQIVKENNLTLTTLLVVGDAIDHRQGLSRLYADEFKHLFRK